MRTPFDIKKGRNVWDRGSASAQLASSPDQLAVVWNTGGEVIAASPAAGDVPNSFEMDITRMPADFNLHAALNMRREKSLEVPPLTGETLYLTTVPGFNERTRILALDGRTLALGDEELAEWLVEAERTMTLGTDNHPIFETALQETACAVTRLPNGLVALTEVPRQFVEAMRGKLRALAGASISQSLNLAIETPLRSAARYFLTASPEGASALRADKETEVTAFLLINKLGFSFGLWSPAAGLFSEYAFPAPSEFSPQSSGGFYRFDAQTREVRVVDPQTGAETSAEETDPNNLETYIRQAFDQLFLQLSPEKLEQLQLSGYSQIVWASELGLTEPVAAIAADYAEKTGLDFHQIGIPADEAVAGGLLFGSFNFGDETVAGAEILAPVNVARDLLVLADTEEVERRRLEEGSIERQRSRAVFALAAVPVIALAFVLGYAVDLVRTQVMLGIREVRAEQRAAELKPALDRRNSYEANLKWYQEFIKQVSFLRRQQPVGTGLLYELNPSYPFAADSSFYVSELKLLPAGGVEIKGLARNKDAVTSFLRALEFSGGAQSGTKLFSNLTYEVQEGVAQAAVQNQPNLPTVAGANFGAAQPAPGVISWSIKGNYAPMAEFIPPDPKTQAAKPNQANAPANQPNPAANPAAAKP